VAVTNDYTARKYNSAGEVVNSRVISSRDVFSELSNIGQTSLKSEFVWNILDNNEINFGGAVKFQQYENNQNLDSDVVRYDINRDGQFDTTVTVPAAQLNYEFEEFENYKSYFYLNDKLKLLNERLILNLGLRYDYFSYSEQGNLSPRLSASYYLVPTVTSINAAYGEYYQTPSLPTFNDRYQSGINRYLENSHARHYVLGFEHILDDGLKLNLEGYYKKYTDLPVSKNFVNFDNRQSRFEEKLTIGKKDVYGIDLLIQQKLVEDYYGTLSFSRMWSDFEDPREGREGETYPSAYDFPYVVTVIVGKRFDNLRSDLNEMPFFIKYPSMILPFSDDMEISLRWRYASGKPYTPQQYVTYEQHREGESGWTEGWWVPTDDLNSKRYPAYHRLDLAFNSRYNFSNWSLSVFLSVQNLYNRKNIAYYQRNSDGTVDNVYQFSLLPVAGIEIEF
jgi:outer membrane receptor protein involved in Fe transport